MAPVTKSKKRALIWFVLLLAVAGVAAYAVRHAGDTAAAPAGGGGGGRGGSRAGLGAIPVVTQTVSRSSMPVYLMGLGNITPYYAATVQSRVDGQLMKIYYNEGDLVKEGQLLAEIDPRPYQVTLELGQAALAKDSALLANAKVDLERYTQLVKTDAIPAQQLDTQKALVAQYEAVVKQDQATIDSAKLNLVYSKVTAPITGIAGLRLTDPGNIVRAASATAGIVSITQVQPITAMFTVPEDSLPPVMDKLRLGKRLPVEAFNRDMSQKLASGMLLSPDNQIDPTTGTAKLKAVFENKDLALYPQQFVNVRILVDTLGNQLVVPNAAIQNGQMGTFVYVVDDTSKVHLRPVKVGITTATAASILSGLADGDRVVTDGTDRLMEGTSVRVRKPGEMENTPDAGGRGGRAGRGEKGAKGDNGAAPAEKGAQGDKGGQGERGGQGGFKKGDGSKKGEWSKKGDWSKKGQ